MAAIDPLYACHLQRDCLKGARNIFGNPVLHFPCSLLSYTYPPDPLLVEYNRGYSRYVTSQGEAHPRYWFVLVYKLPPEPSRYRASVWRKLRAAGAVYLQNGVAALPADQGGERVMRGAVQEIRESDGTAYLMRGPLVGDDAALVEVFNAARDDEYREVLDRCRDFHAELEREREVGKFIFAELEENEEDLAKLEAWFGKVRARDRFGAPLAEETGRAMEACREDLETFAESVYEAADHGSAGLQAT